ncbi:Listeria/Bacterioides repeat-containing protein [Pseudobutyrivibrio sp. YE44]|uniref:InlB B-repeat-containing protein n=1 Tax=Pseudobutyrivibrio sp. YE44 TaxID=1520802 RepID=UPI0008805FB3|nr:InlB B-repeat-containing protein [Pseudobutyrivibrio sp. YE44]SDB30963.1 Listeria/Bacterioides repeat-containing protein [Pseudobutyrivibrio sp. YE44]
MKKRMLACLLTTVCALNLGVMTGCGQTEGAVTEEVNVESAGKLDEHTVTFYDTDGQTVLDTKTVQNKETVDSYTPEKEGYTFVGWYVSPKLTRQFDFTRLITEDTSLYAGFVSYSEDTRTFAIVGSGESQVLKDSDWGKVIGDAQTMTKTDNQQQNEYTITLDLQEGDQFQFAVDSDWADQRGFGYLETGMLDGKTYLKNAGGLGDTPPEKSNIQVEVAGTYTFTLTTYPAEDVYDEENQYYTEETKENFNSNPYDTITWTYSN